MATDLIQPTPNGLGSDKETLYLLSESHYLCSARG